MNTQTIIALPSGDFSLVKHLMVMEFLRNAYLVVVPPAYYFPRLSCASARASPDERKPGQIATAHDPGLSFKLIKS